MVYSISLHREIEHEILFEEKNGFEKGYLDHFSTWASKLKVNEDNPDSQVARTNPIKTFKYIFCL